MLKTDMNAEIAAANAATKEYVDKMFAEGMLQWHETSATYTEWQLQINQWVALNGVPADSDIEYVVADVLVDLAF